MASAIWKLEHEANALKERINKTVTPIDRAIPFSALVRMSVIETLGRVVVANFSPTFYSFSHNYCGAPTLKHRKPSFALPPLIP